MAKPTIVLVAESKVNFDPEKILKRNGFQGVEVKKKTEGLKTFSLEEYKSPKYIAFFVGQIPHKTRASGHCASLLSFEETVLGQPIIRCTAKSLNHSPKLTQSSFEQMILENKEMLLERIAQYQKQQQNFKHLP